MHNHPASVFITIGHTAIQTSLWLVIIALIAVSFLIYQLIHLLRGIYHIPSHFRHFVAERTERKLHQLTSKGLCALLEGRWDACETYFRQGAKKEPYPFFNYVAAAQAAFEQNKRENVIRYFKKAQEIAKPSEALALEIVQVRWYLATKEYQLALMALKKLQEVVPTHPFILNGLKDIYLASQNWQDLQVLLSQLQQYGELDQVTFDGLEQRVLSMLLDQSHPSELEKNGKRYPKNGGKPCRFFLSIPNI